MPDLCTTRITYGQAWAHPAGHTLDYDDVSSAVTWDGVCTDEADHSFALLSNGWRPVFAGHGACTIAIDQQSCAATPGCGTRITYGASWQAATNHPNAYDDVDGRVTWDGRCVASGAQAFATLSNGWQPHFTGAACPVSLRYTQCGGLYANPVIDANCPDPGVLLDAGRYVLSCTSGNLAAAFPLRTSTDLVHFTSAGYVFPAGQRPAWATGDFWAPEIHAIGGHYVAYYTARHTNGRLSIGAASSASPTGPFVDLGQPIVQDPTLGLIDATEYAGYLVWKVDGNAVGQQTPIRIQQLAADGLSLVGAATTLITNDQPWEGGVVEGPWMIAHAGMTYLFYSGNSYADARYAVGVARAATPLGPFTKASAPIVVTNDQWIGPGHGSVLDVPSGDTYLVYHAWRPGHVNGPGDSRVTLVDRIVWRNGWPLLPSAPSMVSQPMP